MPSRDPRLIIGAPVHARARHVTSEAECQRLFGSNWKVRNVEGVVQEVTYIQGKKVRQTIVLATWAIGQRRKEKGLLLRNVGQGFFARPRNPDGTVQTIGREPERPHAFEEATEGDTTESNPISTSCVLASGGDITPLKVADSSNNPTVTPTANVGASAADGDDNSSPALESVIPHGREWKSASMRNPLNGKVVERDWEGKFLNGKVVSFGSEVREDVDLVEYFEAMFPMDFLPRIVSMTNVALLAKNKAVTSNGEILRFFGICLLITRCEFSSRRDLWSTNSYSKYLPSRQLGHLMSRNRFDDLFSMITFSYQPSTSDGMSSAEHRWMLVNDFIAAFNSFRERRFVPSELLCVDESMVRWYGLGGAWIDGGLPHYVSIDRKPEDSCEIHNIACAKSGIMLKMELVTTAEDESKRDFEDTHSHGTAVIMRLAEQWKKTGSHIAADLFFASVFTAEQLLHMGLRFTGVVKNATKEYPMDFLSGLEMSGRGDQRSMLSDSHSAGNQIAAVSWWTVTAVTLCLQQELQIPGNNMKEFVGACKMGRRNDS